MDQDIFEKLTKLECLDLSSNLLSSIDKTIFKKLNSLLEVKLNNNQLSELDSHIFKGLNSLKIIYLANNGKELKARDTYFLEQSVEYLSFKESSERNDIKLVTNMAIINSKYKIINEIGSGCSGTTVYLVEAIQTKNKKYLKQTDKSQTNFRFAIKTSINKYNAREEAKLIQSLNSPFVMRFIEEFEYNSNYFMVTEYFEA